MNVRSFIFASWAICLGLLGVCHDVHAKPQKKVLCNKDSTNKKCEHIKHHIQLQLADTYGFPVEGTEFWVTLDIIKNGPVITVQIPLINFETGQCSAANPSCPTNPPGGFLYTSASYLPEGMRPNTLVPISVVAASNNGLSPAFSYTQDPATLPVPPPGYIVQITNAGELQVQAAGAFGNIIAPGPQIIMPCSLTYIVEKKKKICKNVILSKGATNVTQFPPNAGFSTLRDSHVNDAFDGKAAWVWNENFKQEDKSNGILNLVVAVADVDCKGKISNVRRKQLTNFQPPATITCAFDSAVTIVRDGPYKGAIVVSFTTGDYNVQFEGTISRAVSFDGGKTWPINGPILQSISGTPPVIGDIRGVSSDKFGNVWYLADKEFDEDGNYINRPTFSLSIDGGQTFNTVFKMPFPSDFVPGISFFDFPQYYFGGLGDGSGTYGLWISAQYFYPDGGFDTVPLMGFIPIYGLGSIGDGVSLPLYQFTNTQAIGSIAASLDGRVWVQGIDAFPSTYFGPQVMRFKSPGPIDENYAGPWNISMEGSGPFWFGLPNTISQPVIFGYIPTVQGNIFDEKRQALYSIVNSQVPDYSQNMQIYFSISRDNGLTWSSPILVNNTGFANRGFPSMALDSVTGNLIFGWWDGRHDPTYESVEYMAAVIPAKTLDKIVEKIPLSNPLFKVPAAAAD